MKEKLVSKNDAIALNLNRIDEERDALSELRVMEISELVDEVISSISELVASEAGVYELLAAVAESIGCTEREISEDANDSVLLRIRDKSAEDRAVFAELLSCGLLNIGVSERDFFDTAEHTSTVTYVKNPYSDEAYEVFSEELTDARVRYSRDFSECTKLLYNKEVSYCLLPLEEKGGTRLPTVAEIIYRNDLKINSITPVFGLDNSLDLKYALVSNHFTVPEKTDEDDRYLEIRIPKTDSAYLSELLMVSEKLGYTVFRVDTQCFSGEYSEDMFFSVVVRDNEKLFLPLLVYMTLFIDEYNLVGMYKNLE